MLTLFPQKPRRECGLLCILTHYALVSGTHSTGIWARFGSLDTQSNIRYGRSITADVVASLFVGCWTLETPWRHFGSRINISMSLRVRVVNGQLHEIHGKERLSSLIPHLSSPTQQSAMTAAYLCHASGIVKSHWKGFIGLERQKRRWFNLA